MSNDYRGVKTTASVADATQIIDPDPSPFGFESFWPTILISKVRFEGTITSGLLFELLLESAGSSDEQAITKNIEKIIIFK